MSMNPYQSPEDFSDPISQPLRLPDGQHEYLLTGRSPDGRQVTERVEAPSADAAFELFRQRGYTEIVLHSDEVTALYSGQSDVAANFTPQEYIELRNTGSFWGNVWFMVRKMYRSAKFSNLLLLIIFGFRRYSGLTWNLWDWFLTGILLFPVAIALAAQLFSPARRYTRFTAAVAWGQWEDVLRQVDRLRGRVPAHDLAQNKAKALAGLGRLDEAIQVMQELAHDPQVPAWLFQSFLAEVYSTAKRIDEATEAAEKAVALAPDNATLLLNLALGLLLYRRNLERARELLKQIESHALSDILTPIFQMAQGILALEEGHPQQAKPRLEAAAAGLAPFRDASPLIGPIQDKLHAYLALVAAATGDAKAAQQHFRAAEPRLRALRADELLGRCQQALARIGVQTTTISPLP